MTFFSSINRDGYVFLENWKPNSNLLGLVPEIGEAICLGRGEAVHLLRPRITSDASANTYSGAYGLKQFPLHTDLAHWYTPPRFLALRCVVGSEHVPTLILDSREAIDKIGAISLERSLMLPRRNIQGKRPLLRIYDPIRGLLRWDERYLVPGSPAGSNGCRNFAGYLGKLTASKIWLKSPGDTLIIDNWRILHGRGNVPNQSLDRVIERVYLCEVK